MQRFGQRTANNADDNDDGDDEVSHSQVPLYQYLRETLPIGTFFRSPESFCRFTAENVKEVDYKGSQYR